MSGYKDISRCSPPFLPRIRIPIFLLTDRPPFRIIVRFSTLVAFLPLSVLATPYLVRCGCADDSIDQLKNGLKLAFETLFNQAIKPPRQGALANDTLSPCSTLALLLSILGPVDRLGDALQKGTRPLGDEYVDIPH